jgi:hypothetical protein
MDLVAGDHGHSHLSLATGMSEWPVKLWGTLPGGGT